MKRFLALALLLAAPAYAGTAERLYADGKYDESIKTALAENDAAGFATAARSELAEEASRDRPCLDCLERAESYARRAIAADPGSPWVLAALGGWNIEIVNHAGAGLADWLFGATVKRGLDDFTAAFKTAPDNAVLRYQYALTLSDYDAARYHGEIEDALTMVATATADTAYTRLLQGRARELLELLKKADRAAYAARVRKYEGYP